MDNARNAHRRRDPHDASHPQSTTYQTGVPQPPPGSYQQRQRPSKGLPVPPYISQRPAFDSRNSRPGQHAITQAGAGNLQIFRSPQRPHDDQSTSLPRTAQREPNRHVSYVSALASPQLPLDSRPVSEIDSEYTIGMAMTPTNAAFDNNHLVSPITLHRMSHQVTSKSPPDRIGSHARPGSQKQRYPSTNPAETMEALTSAIRQGLGPSKASSRSATPKPFANGTTVRMPFQDEPESPTSVYTEMTSTQNRSTLPLSAYQGYDPHDSKPSTITEQDADDYEKSNSAVEFPKRLSQTSTQPMMGTDTQGMSARVPISKRPPRLDMAAVREAEARGSMTSLSDLIRRATRLASNLDRGRTASRLGNLDMFGSNEKLDSQRVRNSTYSDVLAAFPPPADGAGTPGRDRPATMWPAGEKQFMASKSSLGRHGDGQTRSNRKWCGLSPITFVLVLVLLILLVAAAVLIPVFLIVLPRQQQKAAINCSSTQICQNEGVSVVVNVQCSCICVNGFTGNNCSQEGDPECTTATILDGISTYNNATVASSVLPILQTQSQAFGIPVNVTAVLSTFASNNLSCASENSLVVFEASNSARDLNVRFVATDLKVAESSNSKLPVSSALTVREYGNFAKVSITTPGSSQIQPTRTVERRQDVTQSANGIVFATSTGTTAQPSVEAASTSASSQTTKPTSTSLMVSKEKRDFGAAVVLYVLQTNSEISVAVAAKQIISTYFQDANPVNATIEVVGGSQRLTADFQSFKIKLANGTHFGGS